MAAHRPVSPSLRRQYERHANVPDPFGVSADPFGVSTGALVASSSSPGLLVSAGRESLRATAEGSGSRRPPPLPSVLSRWAAIGEPDYLLRHQPMEAPSDLAKLQGLSQDRGTVSRAFSCQEHTRRLIHDFESDGLFQECVSCCPPRKVRGMDYCFTNNPRREAAKKQLAPIVSEPEKPGTPESASSSSAASTPSGLKKPKLAKKKNALSNMMVESAATVDPKRAKQLLLETKFFQTIEEANPGALAEIAETATFYTEKPGKVIFRQGDPPSNCYVIASGSVDVFVYKRTGLQDKQPTPRDKNLNGLMSRNVFLAQDLSNGWTQVLGDRSSPKSQSPQKGEKGRNDRSSTLPVYLSSEGFSTFTSVSTLGELQTNMQERSVFGELALSSDDNRAASLRVSEACELLVVPKDVYKRCQSEVEKKQKFLTKHLPGLKKLTYRIIHPATHFVARTFAQGHVISCEGVANTESAIYVVYEGQLELRRYRNPSDNPAYVLASRPLQEESWRNRCCPPASGIAGSRPDEEQPPGMGGEEVIDTIGVGGIYCPLAFMPMTCTEPFTVVVASETCKVYKSAGPEVETFPKLVQTAVRKRVMRDLARRFGEAAPPGGWGGSDYDESSPSVTARSGQASRAASMGASRTTSPKASRPVSTATSPKARSQVSWQVASPQATSRGMPSPSSTSRGKFSARGDGAEKPRNKAANVSFHLDRGASS